MSGISEGWSGIEPHLEFIAAEPLLLDHRIDLSIAWLALLNGKVGLRLCIQGRITKSRDHRLSMEKTLEGSPIPYDRATLDGAGP